MAEETVTVALKHPHGLILKIYDLVDVSEPVMGGGYRDFKQARQKGVPVRLNGYSQRGGKVPPAATAGTFALTHNVPKSFWDQWLAQNQDHDFVEKGLIFAGSPSYVTGQMKAHEVLKSGLEPLDPDHLPLASIKTYDKEAA